MKKINLNKSGFLCLAFAAFGTASFAQQPESPKQDLKVTIIKKTIDGNGTETVEKIERSTDEAPMYFEADKVIINDKAALGVIIEQSEKGVKLTAVQGAAKDAGLKAGDIILGLDGIKISTVEQLQKAVAQHKIGDKVNVEYLRDGKSLNAEATLKAAEREIYVVEKRMDHRRRMHREYDPCKKLEEMRAEPFIGVYINSAGGLSKVSDIIENSGAADSKLKAGDVITKINADEITDYDNLRSVLKNYKPGQLVRISFDRGGKTEKTRVRLSSLAERDPAYTAKLEQSCSNKSETPKKDEAAKTSEIDAAMSIELFPNPATAAITVNFNAAANEKLTLSVSSIEGKELIRLELNSNQEQYSEQINIEKLPKGVYLITVKQGKNIMSRQFSKI